MIPRAMKNNNELFLACLNPPASECHAIYSKGEGSPVTVHTCKDDAIVNADKDLNSQLWVFD